VSGETLVSVDDPLMIAMETLKLRLDSQVTLARPGPGFNQVLLQDIYRLADQPVTVTSSRDWSPGRLLPRAPRRDDFKKIVLKAGVAVSIRGCGMAYYRVRNQKDTCEFSACLLLSSSPPFLQNLVYISTEYEVSQWLGIQVKLRHLLITVVIFTITEISASGTSVPKVNSYLHPCHSERSQDGKKSRFEA
jgi:hypothetical protein